ncbi:LOW QUALITY PROTEIN: serine/threonine-protein kinase pim-1-like [Ammospiza nelsoni]|uniref:LOW QUALITY PROTEIN: serine/threonine-protein kinase pim-1-like n=1 Tax=Ammospiza nelsoni TaxID=2857394 RepID=UPI00286C1D57|nr:LOW QUALITY PROTEIN: serine/threonine-protein kinase pim-1-like [Ammospiza nelsoni]
MNARNLHAQRDLKSAAGLGSQVAIKRVSRECISQWMRLSKGALVPLELVLLWKVSWPGSRGVMQLLDLFEVPEGFALLMEGPQLVQDLWYFLHERQFLTEPVVGGLFCQVLEAVRRCSSRGVLHHHIKAENILVHLAMGKAKIIDFGCGTILQDTFYTRMSGTPEYSPPEWILFDCYHGQPATIWSLGILLYELVCGHLPFHRNEDIVWDQLFFLPGVSQGGDVPSRHEGKNGVGRGSWHISVLPLQLLNGIVMSPQAEAQLACSSGARHGAGNTILELAAGGTVPIAFGCGPCLKDTLCAPEDNTWCPDRTGKSLQRPWSASSASATPGATVCRDSPF